MLSEAPALICAAAALLRAAAALLPEVAPCNLRKKSRLNPRGSDCAAAGAGVDDEVAA